MKTVRILLMEFQDAIDYVKARPGQFPVGNSGQLMILPCNLFTEAYQMKFLTQYLKRNKNEWLERSCRIKKSAARKPADRHLIIQMVDGETSKASVINIDSFTWQAELDEDWETAGTKKRKTDQSPSSSSILDDTLFELSQLRKDHEVAKEDNIKLKKENTTVKAQLATREKVHEKSRLNNRLYKTRYNKHTLVTKSKYNQKCGQLERQDYKHKAAIEDLNCQLKNGVQESTKSANNIIKVTRKLKRKHKNQLRHLKNPNYQKIRRDRVSLRQAVSNETVVLREEVCVLEKDMCLANEEIARYEEELLAKGDDHADNTFMKSTEHCTLLNSNRQNVETFSTEYSELIFKLKALGLSGPVIRASLDAMFGAVNKQENMHYHKPSLSYIHGITTDMGPYCEMSAALLISLCKRIVQIFHDASCVNGVDTFNFSVVIEIEDKIRDVTIFGLLVLTASTLPAAKDAFSEFESIQSWFSLGQRDLHLVKDEAEAQGISTCGIDPGGCSLMKLVSGEQYALLTSDNAPGALKVSQFILDFIKAGRTDNLPTKNTLKSTCGGHTLHLFLGDTNAAVEPYMKDYVDDNGSHLSPHLRIDHKIDGNGCCYQGV
jgi:hypothetical protein